MSKKRFTRMLEGQDQLAGTPNFGYEASGTAVGGCCSIIVSILIFTFLCQRLLTLWQDPQFNQVRSFLVSHIILYRR